jgi:2-keto-4-pentenoate hydratase
LRTPGTKSPMTSWKLDDRIVRGMSALKRKLQADAKSGAHLVGWKLGFGSPSALANLQIDRPLVGYLLDRNQIANDESVKISTWSKPIGEAEIAIYFGKDIPQSASIDQIMACISALGPAIEIADLNLVPTDPETILGEDIFQRHYILGEKDELRAGGNIEGLIANISMPDSSITRVTNLQALTGEIPTILHHFATFAEEFDEGVKAGQFVIIGSIVPPILVSAGESFSYSLGGYNMLKVNFLNEI